MSAASTARRSSTPTRASGGWPQPTSRRSRRRRLFDAPIRTTLEPLEAFYVAEDYHHDYAARNPGQPYIRMVAEPKVSKLREVHGDLLKAG